MNTKIANSTGLSASGQSFKYVILVLAILALALVGYGGFVLFPSLDLPAGAGLSLFGLALAAGVASFFSPCSFPLLVSMLARPVAGNRQEGGVAQSAARPLKFAAALSAGAAAFLLILGLLVALGGSQLFEGIAFTSASGRILRIVVGGFLILMGLIQLNRITISLRHFEPALQGFLHRQSDMRGERPIVRSTLFGFAYLAAGFGCTGPILAGLAGQSFTIGGFTAAFAAFGVAAVAIVTLMFTLALVVGTAQERTVAAMRASAPAVKRWGARILLIVGSWFIALGVFADFFAPVFGF